jgi:hypothetical protein
MSKTNRDRITEFARLMLEGRTDEARTLLHKDFCVREADSLPYAGVYEGIEGWNTLWGRVGSTWADLEIVPDESPIGEPDGDQFGWMMKMSGRSVKTGRGFSMTVFERWTLRDNLIYEILPHYWDAHAVAAADADNES